jgi:hypothetical protein
MYVVLYGYEQTGTVKLEMGGGRAVGVTRFGLHRGLLDGCRRQL